MTTDKKAVFDDAFRRYYEKCLLFARSYTHDLSLSEDIGSGGKPCVLRIDFL